MFALPPESRPHGHAKVYVSVTCTVHVRVCGHVHYELCPEISNDTKEQTKVTPGKGNAAIIIDLINSNVFGQGHVF